MENQKTPLVSIVTVNYLKPAITVDMLTSLSKVNYPNLEVILVDNATEVDNSSMYKAAFSGRLKVFQSAENLGFAGGTNYGIRKSMGEYILLLNNDTVVSPGFLQPLVDCLEQAPELGFVCPKIYFYGLPSVIQYAGATRINPVTGRGEKLGYAQRDEGQFEQSRPTHLGNGACMLVRRAVFEEVGLLSELYFMYYEEHDFARRAKAAGWTFYYCAQSFIYHRQSISIGKNSPLKTYYLVRNRILFMRRFNNLFLLSTFLTYYGLVSLPKQLVKHLLRREYKHLSNIMKGISWNIFNHKINVKNENLSLSRS